MDPSVTGVSEHDENDRLSGVSPFLSADNTDAVDLYYTCSSSSTVEDTPLTTHTSPR
jgi:hypothetical protein